MKPAFLLSLLLWSISTAAEKAPEPVKLPTEIRLTDGRILKNAVVIKQTSEAVSLRHAGGAALVRYEFFPAGVRPVLERVRPGGSRLPAGDTALDRQVIEGQVFIQTRGAGAHKFGNIPVYAFSDTAFSLFASTPAGVVRLPPPLGQTVSDADGKFKLAVPRGQPFFLFVQGQRLMLDGTTERFEWRAPSTEIKFFEQVNLSDEWRYSQRVVWIEKLE